MGAGSSVDSPSTCVERVEDARRCEAPGRGRTPRRARASTLTLPRPGRQRRVLLQHGSRNAAAPRRRGALPPARCDTRRRGSSRPRRGPAGPAGRRRGRASRRAGSRAMRSAWTTRPSTRRVMRRKRVVGERGWRRAGRSAPPRSGEMSRSCQSATSSRPATR